MTVCEEEDSKWVCRGRERFSRAPLATTSRQTASAEMWKKEEKGWRGNGQDSGTAERGTGERTDSAETGESVSERWPSCL